MERIKDGRHIPDNPPVARNISSNATPIIRKAAQQGGLIRFLKVFKSFRGFRAFKDF